jgi:hypothetical protein
LIEASQARHPMVSQDIAVRFANRGFFAATTP